VSGHSASIKQKLLSKTRLKKALTRGMVGECVYDRKVTGRETEREVNKDRRKT
jgi:hypothetical protein